MNSNKYFESSEKRFLDLSISFLFLLFSIPIFILLYPILLLCYGNPVVFKQLRMGKDKVPFTMYKIRTMYLGAEKLQKSLLKYNQAPSPMFKMENDPRFTKIGKLLSQLGIDELPQIINIIKGEMSFVGPRPLPIQEANRLDKSWDFRYSVRPGILSKWAVSKDRHKSLEKWKKLEIETLKISTPIQDLQLFTTYLQMILKSVRKLFNSR